MKYKSFREPLESHNLKDDEVTAFTDFATDETTFRTLFELSPDPIALTLFGNGQFLRVNPAWCELYGFAPEQVVGRTSLDLGLWPDPQDRELLHANLLAQGSVTQFESTLFSREGIPLHVIFSARVLEIQGKQCVLWMLKDITERHRTAKSLQESEYFFRESQRVAAIGSYKTDFTKGLWESSEVLDTIFGIDKSYNRSVQGWLDIVHPDDRDMINRYLLEEIIHGGRPFSKEYRINRKEDGSTRWVHGHGEVAFGSDGHIVSMIGTIQDITERKLSEEKLRESEERLKAITDSALDAVIIMDQEGRIAYWNKAATRIFGYPSDEAVGKNLHQFLVPGRYHEEHLAGFPEFQRTGRGLAIGDTFELEARHKNGYEFPVEVSISNLKLHDGWNALGIIRDITKRKAAEEEKAKLEAQLQQAQKMEGLGVLVAGVAHNFNNMLAIIMGTASFREQSAVDPLDRKAYKTIGKVCRRGRDVVKSLLQFARPTLSIKAPFELHELIKEVCALLENTTSKRIKITEVLVEEPLWINGDAGTINHCFLNLCINAIDSMPGGGTLILRTAIPETDWVEVSFQDNGEGMTQEVLAHALEPFFTTKDVGKGTGLGLSMTYGVIKAHGGTMDISSQPGHGTAVKIRLPRTHAPILEDTPGAQASSLVPMNVLLVDDEEDARFLIKRMLKKAGVHQVRTFSGGKEAIESLRSGPPPNLIILDQNMPGMDGVQTMEKIRNLHPHLPILISSGQPGIQDWACFQQPNVAVIPKPFDMEEIMAKLAEFTMKQNLAP